MTKSQNASMLETEPKPREETENQSHAHANAVRSEFISQRAYNLFERRGCIHGFDLEDWLEAEKQLAEELMH